MLELKGMYCQVSDRQGSCNAYREPELPYVPPSRIRRLIWALEQEVPLQHRPLIDRDSWNERRWGSCEVLMPIKENQITAIVVQMIAP